MPYSAGCYARRAAGGCSLLDVAERLRDAGAGLRSIAEPWADTTSLAGRMVLTVFAGIAEFERALIWVAPAPGGPRRNRKACGSADRRRWRPIK